MSRIANTSLHVEHKADRVISRFLWILCLLIGVSGSAIAQGRVCLFEQPNYQGRSVCFNQGENQSDLQSLAGGWNDRVGSIRLTGNVQATIHEDVGFGGASFKINSDVPNVSLLRTNELRNWRTGISSITVERREVGGQQGSANRVCIYELPNYRGQSACFNAGESVSDLHSVSSGQWNDRVGSIRIFGNARVSLYQHVGFDGASNVVTSDIPNVAQLRDNVIPDWSREISAIRVERGGAGGAGPGPLPGPISDDRVCIYARPNYGGRSHCFNAGQEVGDLANVSGAWNDQVASIRLFGNARAVIYEDPGFGGASFTVASDIPNLSVIRGRELRNWRRDVSSIRAVGGPEGSDTPSSEAFRMGERDYTQGRPQDYRAHRGRYNRSNERDFQREYDLGYTLARDGSADSGEIAGLNRAFAGDGQLQLGTRTSPVAEVFVRLLPGGVARFEVVGDRTRSSLSGNWSNTNRGPIEVTINEGFGTTRTTGTGRIFAQNGTLRRIELSGQTNRQSFSLNFRSNEGGGVGSIPRGGRPSGTVILHGAITNRASGKSLDVVAGGTGDGTRVQQWDFSRQPNHTWQIIDLGNSEVAIIADHSEKALSVQGNRTDNGASIVTREWNNNAFQRWRVEQIGGGFYRIVNVGSGKVLDVVEQSMQNGASIQQWDYANQQNQQWRLDR